MICVSSKSYIYLIFKKIELLIVLSSILYRIIKFIKETSAYITGNPLSFQIYLNF